MPRKRHKPEEIVAKLRQVDVLTSLKMVSAFETRSGEWCARRTRTCKDAGVPTILPTKTEFDCQGNPSARASRCRRSAAMDRFGK